MKTPVLVAVLIALVAITGFFSFVLAKPNPYPIPAANVNVTLPKGVPYKQLTTGAWDDFYPAWSPNGTLIAYVSSKSGEPALWIMNADGSGAFQASSGSEAVGCPSWNPNSTNVAYWSMNGQDSEIDIYNAANNSTVTVPGSSSFAVQTKPAWSPDGLRLAFFVNNGAPQLIVFDLNAGKSAAAANASGPSLTVAWGSNDELLYSTSVDGYQQINWLNIGSGAGGALFSGGGNYTAPAVSWNGTIAYYSDFNTGSYSMYYVGYGGFNIWVAGPDGSNAIFQYVTAVENEAGSTIVQIPYVPGAIDETYQPAWSPDGTLLVYTAYASGTGYSMFMWDISSWASSQIGPYGMGDCIEPSWSPDGSSIAYSSDVGGFYHIWLLSINGNLTSSLVGY